MNETVYLKKCINKTEQILEWGPIDDWDNSRYGQLSDWLFEKTGILVGVSSLKRLLAEKKLHDLPQPEAKDALVQLQGFESWDKYLIEKETEEDLQRAAKEKKKYSAKKSFRVRLAMYILSGAIALFTMIYLIIQLFRQQG